MTKICVKVSGQEAAHEVDVEFPIYRKRKILGARDKQVGWCYECAHERLTTVLYVYDTSAGEPELRYSLKLGRTVFWEVPSVPSADLDVLLGRGDFACSSEEFLNVLAKLDGLLPWRGSVVPADQVVNIDIQSAQPHTRLRAMHALKDYVYTKAKEEGIELPERLCTAPVSGDVLCSIAGVQIKRSELPADGMGDVRAILWQRIKATYGPQAAERRRGVLLSYVLERKQLTKQLAFELLTRGGQSCSQQQFDEAANSLIESGEMFFREGTFYRPGEFAAFQKALEAEEPKKDEKFEAAAAERIQQIEAERASSKVVELKQETGVLLWTQVDSAPVIEAARANCSDRPVRTARYYIELVMNEEYPDRSEEEHLAAMQTDVQWAIDNHGLTNDLRYDEVRFKVVSRLVLDEAAPNAVPAEQPSLEVDPVALKMLKTWASRFEAAAAQEGWILTNNSAQETIIAKLDVPEDWTDEAGEPQLDFTDPKFIWDEEAQDHVQKLANAGSLMHQVAWRIHQAKIPYV